MPTTLTPPRPRLSRRLLDEFRQWRAREAERRAIAQMDPHLRRDVGLPAPFHPAPFEPWSGR